MRHRFSFTLYGLLCLLGGATLVAGCADNQIGRPCDSLGKMPQSGVTFVNPAPDCPSRLCMVTPPVSTAVNGTGATGHTETLSMCTAACSSDSDCATSSDYMTTGATGCSTYKCAVPSVLPGAENFCCQTLCMCADDLIPGFNKNAPGSAILLPTDPNTGLTIPVACQASNPNRCQYPTSS